MSEERDHEHRDTSFLDIRYFYRDIFENKIQYYTEKENFHRLVTYKLVAIKYFGGLCLRQFRMSKRYAALSAIFSISVFIYYLLSAMCCGDNLHTTSAAASHEMTTLLIL